ncbi:hypothetical protein REPUB_Repub20aG0058300 [Reevesia pubescens]
MRLDDSIEPTMKHHTLVVDCWRWEDVERVRMLMQKQAVDKDPGWSYIEVEVQVHRDKHQDCEELKSMWGLPLSDEIC